MDNSSYYYNTVLQNGMQVRSLFTATRDLARLAALKIFEQIYIPHNSNPPIDIRVSSVIPFTQAAFLINETQHTFSKKIRPLKGKGIFGHTS